MVRGETSAVAVPRLVPLLVTSAVAVPRLVPLLVSCSCQCTINAGANTSAGAGATMAVATQGITYCYLLLALTRAHMPSHAVASCEHTARTQLHLHEARLQKVHRLTHLIHLESVVARD